MYLIINHHSDHLSLALLDPEFIFESTHSQLFPSALEDPFQQLREGLKPMLGKLLKHSIEKIIYLPPDQMAKAKFMSLVIAPTDDFQSALSHKLFVRKASKENQYLYNILAENSDERIEYLLNILSINRKFYEKCNHYLLNRFQHPDLLWAPASFAIFAEHLFQNDALKKSLFIWLEKEQTDLLYLDQKKWLSIKPLQFSENILLAALKEVGYSDNQIKNFLSFDLDLNETPETKWPMTVDRLFNHLTDDLKHHIHYLMSSFPGAVNHVYLCGNAFQDSGLDVWLNYQLSLPVDWQKTIAEDPDKPEIGLQAARRLLEQHQLYIPVRIYRKATKPQPAEPRKKMIKSIRKNPFIKLSIFLITVISIFISLNVLIQSHYQRSQQNLYSIKNKLLAVKERYLHSIETSKDQDEMDQLYGKLQDMQRIRKDTVIIARDLVSSLPPSVAESSFLFSGQGKTLSLESMVEDLDTLYPILIRFKNRPEIKDLSIDHYKAEKNTRLRVYMKAHLK